MSGWVIAALLYILGMLPTGMIAADVLDKTHYREPVPWTYRAFLVIALWPLVCPLVIAGAVINDWRQEDRS